MHIYTYAHTSVLLLQYNRHWVAFSPANASLPFYLVLIYSPSLSLSLLWKNWLQTSSPLSFSYTPPLSIQFPLHSVLSFLFHFIASHFHPLLSNFFLRLSFFSLSHFFTCPSPTCLINLAAHSLLPIFQPPSSNSFPSFLQSHYTPSLLIHSLINSLEPPLVPPPSLCFGLSFLLPSFHLSIWH